MEFKGKTVVVVGLARSGVSAANLLSGRGANVIVADSKEISLLREAVRQLDPGVRVEAGPHSEETFSAADLIVVSPGVPMEIPVLRHARERGVEVIGEVELGFRLLPGTYVAVTGTNGKSTTTTLIGKMLERTGREVRVCGNIGTPLTSIPSGVDPRRTCVIEISSFQLEGIREFRPRVAVLLNVSPDHLNRYAGMEEYAQAKARVFMNQQPEDFAVVNLDDPWSTLMTRKIRSRKVPISLHRRVDRGVYSSGGKIFSTLSGREEEILSVEEMRIQGIHNIENAMAAAAAALVSGCGPDQVRSVLATFPGLPHRMELVGEFHGVRYINDSKGTNIGALLRSLQSIQAPIHLIAGGQGKGAGYHPLRELVSDRVDTLILIGEAADAMEEDLRGTTQIRRAETLEEAVGVASKRARRGSVVLLSPGCASFDMFSNFEERGKRFVDEVRHLMAGGK